MLRALLLVVLLFGCAEMKQPPPPPGSNLGGGAADPVRGAILTMAPAFADNAKALQGRPAATAEAAARLEYVTQAIGRDDRYASLTQGLRRDLLLARQELRDALGIAADLPPDDAVRGLTAASRALRAQQRDAAAAALPGPGFRPGGAANLARLADVGPLPQAAIASNLAVDEVARLDAMNGWSLGRIPESPSFGPTGFGLNDQPSDSY